MTTDEIKIEQIGNNQTLIRKGNQGVVINVQGASVWANVYVNCRNGLQDADITLTRWEGKTYKGAERWALKKLNRN